MTPAERLRALAAPGNESIESMRRGLLVVAEYIERMEDRIAMMEASEDHRRQREIEALERE